MHTYWNSSSDLLSFSLSLDSRGQETCTHQSDSTHYRHILISISSNYVMVDLRFEECLCMSLNDSEIYGGGLDQLLTGINLS